MTRILHPALLALLALSPLAAPAHATSCSADVMLLPSGKAVLAARTDAEGAWAVVLLYVNQDLSEMHYLRDGAVLAVSRLPLVPGDRLQAIFINRAQRHVCVEEIDIVGPDPIGDAGLEQPDVSR